MGGPGAPSLHWASMPEPQDVHAYLERLGVTSAAPSLELLTELHVAHLERVPFENLDIHRGVPIRIDEPSILAKLARGRGGFCYELNGGFGWLLRALGFDVTYVEGRVAHRLGGYGIRFDHLALVVQLRERHLVDVGFGDSFLRPLRLIEGVVQEDAAGTFRIRRLGASNLLERRGSDGHWAHEFRWLDAPRELTDFEPGSRYHQSSRVSSFTQRAICTRVDAGTRITLHRDRLVRGDRTVPIEGEDDWRRALAAHFGITLSDEPSA